jgi:hypothetical protein
MAADRLLVQGAGQVARAGASGKLAAGVALTEAADFISEGTNKVIQARNRNFNSAMKAELAKTGDLTDEEYKDYEKKLRRQRFKYVYLNKRGRMQAEQEVNQAADELIAVKKQKTKIATTTIEDPNKDLGGCNAEALTKIISGELKPLKDENGNLGYNMPDGRECYAFEQEELREFVRLGDNNEVELAGYKEAWDDGRFKLSEDGKFKVDKFGNKYPNTKEGFQLFVDAAEAYWKSVNDKTGGVRNLNIDTQTGKQSEHAVWQKDNEGEFSGSPNKMVSPMKFKNQEQDTNEEEKEEPTPKASKSFMSMQQINDMVDNASVDKASFGAIQSIVANTAIRAEAIQPGENNEFNYKKSFNNIKQQIVSKGNLRSLAQNTNPFGRVFMEDLVEAILSSSYEEMGIPSGVKDKGKIQASDPTPRTPINPGDAQVIAKSIYNDKKLLTNYISEYYTNMAEQNFNDNLKPEVAQNFDFKLTQQEALASARRRFGPGKTFSYRGNVYSTSTDQDTAKDEDEFA